MSMRTLFIGLASVALLSPSRSPAGRADVACTIAIIPYFQSDDMTYVVATALDSSLSDQTDSLAVTSSRRVLLPIASRGTVEGQLLRVQFARGVGVDSLSRRLAVGDSLAVLIRWGLAGDCSPTPMGAGIPPGEVNHFIVALRPRATWIQGHPTFEVGPTSQFGIYPGWLRTQLGPDASFLTAGEFNSFAAVLPTDRSWRSDCRGAVKQLKQWTDDHRALAKKYPVPDALRQLEFLCAKQRS